MTSRIIKCALAIVFGTGLGIQTTGAVDSEELFPPVMCSEDDVLINNEFCIQSVPNGTESFNVASASSTFPHPLSDNFPELRVVAVLCDGSQMLKAFRFTLDDTDSTSSQIFPLFDRYWVNDSIALMNHVPVGVLSSGSIESGDLAWAATLSFDSFEIEDSSDEEVKPMVRVKNINEEFESFKCYDPNDYGLYLESSGQ